MDLERVVPRVSLGDQQGLQHAVPWASLPCQMGLGRDFPEVSWRGQRDWEHDSLRRDLQGWAGDRCTKRGCVEVEGEATEAILMLVAGARM